MPLKSYASHLRRACCGDGFGASAAILLLAQLACAGAHAQQSGPDATVSQDSAQHSMRVFIDPKTGERRLPQHQEMRSMRRSAPVPSAEQPLQVIHRDGMRFVDVPPARRSHLQGQLDEKGRVQIGHGLNHE